MTLLTSPVGIAPYPRLPLPAAPCSRLQDNPGNFNVPFPLAPADLSSFGTRVRAVGGESKDLLQRIKEADNVDSESP